MSLRGWQRSSAVALTAAVVWMALPTFPMTWMVDPVPTGTLVTWASRAAPHSEPTASDPPGRPTTEVHS